MRNKRDPVFTRKLISLVMPIAFQQFMLALVSASDALMLGVISQDSLSAVSLAGQVTFIHSLLLEAMTIGLSLIAAQYWGKGDIPAVERIFAFVTKVTTVISLIFTLSALLLPGMLMRIFTNDPVLIRGGSLYLRVIAVSYLLTGISQMYLCILKNSGRAAKKQYDQCNQCGDKYFYQCSADLRIIRNAQNGDCRSCIGNGDSSHH